MLVRTRRTALSVDWYDGEDCRTRKESEEGRREKKSSRFLRRIQSQTEKGSMAVEGKIKGRRWPS